MRFVVISVLPAILGEGVEALSRIWSHRLGSPEVLRYPPHVTLRTGLVCPDDQADAVATDFLTLAARSKGVDTATQGLYAAQYPVKEGEHCLVGWSVARTPLEQLHAELLDYRPWQKGPQAEFRPHVSLVYGAFPLDRGRLLVDELNRAALAPPLDWRLDHVSLYYETPSGWVEWGRADLGSR